MLRGWDGSTDYRLGVYAFYATHKDKTEREKYLKDYHGEYSGQSGGNDNLTHTRGKGIEFSHGSITAPLCQGHAEMAGGGQTHRGADLPEQISLRCRLGGHAGV